MSPVCVFTALNAIRRLLRSIDLRRIKIDSQRQGFIRDGCPATLLAVIARSYKHRAYGSPATVLTSKALYLTGLHARLFRFVHYDVKTGLST